MELNIDNIEKSFKQLEVEALDFLTLLVMIAQYKIQFTCWIALILQQQNTGTLYQYYLKKNQFQYNAYFFQRWAQFKII